MSKKQFYDDFPLNEFTVNTLHSKMSLYFTVVVFIYEALVYAHDTVYYACALNSAP